MGAGRGGHWPGELRTPRPAEPSRTAATNEADDALGSGRVLIVDDCRIFRECLAGTLESIRGVDPALAWDLPSLVQALGAVEVAVVLLTMTTHGSHLLLRAAMDVDPTIRVIALGLSEEDETAIVACAEAGVAGYHLRGDSFEDLIAMMHKVGAGEICCPPSVATILLQRLLTITNHSPATMPDVALTAREVQILEMLVLGRSNREIADRMKIAVHTVKNHVHSLLTKLGVTTRAEAAELWQANGTDRGSRWT